MQGTSVGLSPIEQAEYQEYLDRVALIEILERFDREAQYQLQLRESLPRDEKQVAAANWLHQCTGLELTAGEIAVLRAEELQQVARDFEYQRAE